MADQQEAKKEEKAQETPPPQPSANQPSPAPAATAPAAGEPAKKKAKEKPSNCAACNKSIKKKRWYYRNGKFYCTKRCWRTTAKKEQKPKEQNAAETKTSS